MLIYAFFLTLNLGYMSIQWDEMSHLNGALVLMRGHSLYYMQTYGYYPPLYDLISTGIFQILGASVFSGRLLAVIFSLLSVWVTFEIANKMYGPKIGLISGILLGLMPGFFWVSRVAMLETALTFFFSLALLLFFYWIRTDKNKFLILTGIILGLGFLAKYQMLVAGLFMVILVLFLFRGKLRKIRRKFLLIVVIALAIVIPWIFILYQINGLKTFGELVYVISAGGQDRTLYSLRFPAPIFYLVEMTWPFNDIPVHPISLPIFIFGLVGLGLWAYRRKAEDKFLLLWFITVIGFFTLLPNKQWRYVITAFPVVAISAGSLMIFAYDKFEKAWKLGQLALNKKRLMKVAAVFLVALAVGSAAYSGVEAYQMVARDQIHVTIQDATNYVAQRIEENQSIMVACAINIFNQDMVRFYLDADSSKNNLILQYPQNAVDAFQPNFNITEFIELCVSNNVKYVLLYEYGATFPYFNSTLTLHDVYIMLNDSGRFTYEDSFGANPRLVVVLSFT
jgi:4-amino-4-deoxy-L-arabinose transferase-like glycosyltransferase